MLEYVKFYMTLIQSGRGTGPMTPGNRQLCCSGANSSRRNPGR
ncbi:hypothetical protein SpAn4DRAFT_4937 [Sporomusa ovata]|uniref:Uncharacterized protein n=1 Tax=Sporomusa ovata TaxID=2378 RepID=A0A0U1KX87_9FIRM|nr:hypothetical protein SpAn4DRAFT_4937 [Sporomusa ovata]